MLEQLKSDVCRANLELAERGIVLYTWGNVSGIDRESGLVVIKPSGVPYNGMSPDDMVVVTIEGEIVEGHYKPSSDTPTHLELYRHFPNIGGVVHTHSRNAVSFAQAGMSIPALGTTHADYFYGEVPCTRALTEEEVMDAYELNTGKVIAETFELVDYLAVPGVLVRNHGPFCWGNDAAEAVYHAVVLEEIAYMARATICLNPCSQTEKYVLTKHYERKHGANAYYGQPGYLLTNTGNHKDLR